MIAVEGLSEGERDATLGTRGAVEARDIARRPRFSFDFVGEFRLFSAKGFTKGSTRHPTNSYLSTVLSTHRLRLMRGSIIGGCTLSRDIRSSRAVGSLVWSLPFSDTHTFAAIGTFLCGLTTSVKTYRPLFGGVPMTFDPG